MTAVTTAPTDDLTAEVTAWLEANWDPDLTVEEWWERLGRSGWAVPTWPEEWFGKGLSRAEGVAVDADDRRVRPALGAPGGLGMLLAGPTIVDARHRRAEGALPPRHRHRPAGVVPALQRARRRLRPRRPQRPGRARRRRVDRQRPEGVDLGRPRSPTSACCSPAPTPRCPSTRASPTSPSTCTSPASTSGPLREMTGRAMFNEVFLTDARVPADAAIGGREQRLGGRQHDARCSSAPASAPAAARRQRRPRCPGTDRRRPRAARRRLRQPAAGDVADAAVVVAAAMFGAQQLLIDLAQGQRHDRRSRRSARIARRAPLAERDRPLHQPPRIEGGEGGRRDPGPRQHRQAVDEPDRAPHP